MKRIVLFLALLLISALLACDSDNENNIIKDFILNNDGTDIIAYGNQISIALRINGDLYLLKSNDGESWKPQLIKANTNIGDFAYRSILDCYQGLVKICFMDDNDNKVYYYDDANMYNQYSTVLEYEGEYYKYDYSFTIDVKGNFYLLFGNKMQKDILFFQDTDNWKTKEFSFDDYISRNIGMKIDQNGLIHIFILLTEYYAEYGGYLLHLYGTNENWELEKIGQNVVYADFSIDARGIIYLIYDEYREDAPNSRYQTYYMMKTEFGWVEADFVDEVKKLYDFGGSNGIIATDEGILHFFGSKSYQPSAKQTLHYLSNKNGIWEKSSIAESYSDNFGSFSFTVDDENNAHIVYCDSEDTFDTVGPVKLYYVTDKTGEWVRHEVDFTP